MPRPRLRLDPQISPGTGPRWLFWRFQMSKQFDALLSDRITVVEMVHFAVEVAVRKLS